MVEVCITSFCSWFLFHLNSCYALTCYCTGYMHMICHLKRKAWNVIDRIVDRKREDTRVGARVRTRLVDDWSLDMVAILLALRPRSLVCVRSRHSDTCRSPGHMWRVILTRFLSARRVPGLDGCWYPSGWQGMVIFEILLADGRVCSEPSGMMLRPGTGCWLCTVV